MSSLSFLNFRHKVSRKSSFRQNKVTNTTAGAPSPSATRTFHPSVEEMRSVFNKFDTNKDGKISEEEYKSAVRVMGGRNVKISELDKAFQAADIDGDGFIDFDEFIKVHLVEGGVKKGEIEEAFRVFDLDGNGQISAEELLEVMRRLGERSNLEACRKMIKAVDGDGDGLINMDEFMIMMTRNMSLSVA